MIVEVRTYKIKPGRRDEFLELFESQAVPAQRSLGIKILGPLVDIENDDTFVFLRGFPTLEARDEMKAAFYEGPKWKNELEALAMPMLDSYVVTLAEAGAEALRFE